MGGKRASHAFFLSSGLLDIAYAFADLRGGCRVPVQRLNEGDIYFRFVCMDRRRESEKKLEEQCKCKVDFSCSLWPVQGNK